MNSGLALDAFLRKSSKASYLLLRTAARLSSFHRKAKRLAFKAVLRCLGGDLSAVIASASRRPRTSKCLVMASSRPVPLVTPAFQFSGSAELQRRCSFPFGSLRLPRVPLGGFATSRTPLAAVAARGAVDNINVSDRSLATYFFQCQRLLLCLPILCIIDTIFLAI